MIYNYPGATNVSMSPERKGAKTIDSADGRTEDDNERTADEIGLYCKLRRRVI